MSGLHEQVRELRAHVGQREGAGASGEGGVALQERSGEWSWEQGRGQGPRTPLRETVEDSGGLARMKGFN